MTYEFQMLQSEFCLEVIFYLPLTSMAKDIVLIQFVSVCYLLVGNKFLKT